MSIETGDDLSKTESAQRELYPRVYTSRTKSDPVTSIIVGAQVVVGIVLATTAGPVFAHAMTSQSTMLWPLGGVCLVTGVALTVAGLTSTKRRTRALLSRDEPSAEPEDTRDASVPMLGALLVYKFGVITEAQLNRALEQQRRERRRGRDVKLGELLVEMGLVNERQLRKALDHQHARGGKWQG